MTPPTAPTLCVLILAAHRRTYNSTPPIGRPAVRRSLAPSAGRAVRLRRIGRERAARRLDVAAAPALQQLERLSQALPDHLRIVSSACGKAGMLWQCRDRQRAERLCVLRTKLSVAAASASSPGPVSATSKIARRSLSSSGSGKSSAAKSSTHSSISRMRDKDAEQDLAVAPARRRRGGGATSAAQPAPAARPRRLAPPGPWTPPRRWPAALSANRRSRKNRRYSLCTVRSAISAGLRHQPAFEIGAPLRRVDRAGARARPATASRPAGGPRRASRAKAPGAAAADQRVRVLARRQHGKAQAAAGLQQRQGAVRARAARRAGRRHRRRSTAPARAPAATIPAAAPRSARCRAAPPRSAKPARCSAMTSM